MSKYKNLAELNRLSDEMFAEFGFHSLTDEEKEIVLKHYISEHMHEYCESKVMYTEDCKKIIDELSYDVFADDPMTGQRANNFHQAAYLALEGALYGVDIETIIKSKLNLNKDG